MASEIKYWLGLGQVEGIGRITYKALIDELKEPGAVFEASEKRIEQIHGIGKKVASAIKSFNDWGWVEKETALIEKHKVKFLTMRDADYPDALRSMPDPPPYLY